MTDKPPLLYKVNSRWPSEPPELIVVQPAKQSKQFFLLDGHSAAFGYRKRIPIEECHLSAEEAIDAWQRARTTELLDIESRRQAVQLQLEAVSELRARAAFRQESRE